MIDLYAGTVILHNYADPPDGGAALLPLAIDVVRAALPWLRAGLIKVRNSKIDDDRRGILAFGKELDDRVREGASWYAVDLRLHQDCGLYLDTRNVRAWATHNLSGKSVLNTFAYSGSLGVAALGGGASRVLQLDRSQRFLDLAKASYRLNGLAIRKQDFVRADFFREVGRLRRLKQTFDCVFLDPPYFSSTAAGVVDQQSQSARLINKVRPLVAPGGYLVAINNALYLSGASYLQVLESLCADGYMEITELLPVPEDFVGMSRQPGNQPITDPSPFNHSTKIAVLRITSQRS